MEMVPVRTKQKEINAADIEHVGTLAAGAAMLLIGLRRGGIGGAIMKLGGIGLIYRGQKGYRRLYELVGVPLPAQPTGVGLQNVRVDAQIVVARPREEIYQIWRTLENLPVFMEHLLSVHDIGNNRSIWVARAPVGTVVKWEAKIINDTPNELIAWESLEGSGVDNAGSVHFEDADGGTRIRVILRYDPPGDMLGVWVAKLFGTDAQSEIEKDLHRFKRIMEIGGAATEAEKAVNELTGNKSGGKKRNVAKAGPEAAG